MTWGKNQKAAQGKTVNATKAAVAPKQPEPLPIPGAEEGDATVKALEAVEAAGVRIEDEAGVRIEDEAGGGRIAEMVAKHEGVLITIHDMMAAMEKRLTDQADKLRKLDMLVRGKKAVDQDDGHLHGSISND